MTTESVAAEGEAKTTAWCIDVPFLTHPLMLKGYAKALIITGGIMGALLSFLAQVSGEGDAIVSMWALTGIVMAVFVVAGALGTALVMGNRMALRFVLDERGIERFVVDRRVGAVADSAVVAGLLAGSPGMTGAGLLARSQRRGSAAWSGLVTASFHPRHHAISLGNAWRTVMVVFCTPENYAEVAARIERELAPGRGRSHARRNPLPGLLLRTAIAVLACLPFFVLPWPFELDLFIPLLTLCFALAAVWLVPHLAVVSLGGLAWMWVDIASRALAERHSSFDGSVYRIWDTMRADTWAPLAITAVASIALVTLAIGLLHGRLATALATDEEELELEERSGNDRT